MKFGENLKLIRKQKNISQEVLAEKLGVARQSVSKWETGENYPSMTNIMCLCDIFKCHINELVHEDFVDINFLDEEIKMNVVKFKEKEQKSMKIISKIIYIIARISKIVGWVVLGVAALFTIIACIFIPQTKINTNKHTIKFRDNNYKYVVNNDEFSIYRNKSNKIVVIEELTDSELASVNKVLTKSNTYILSCTLLLTITLLISGFFTIKMFSYLEKLFVNIHNNDTPFTMENVKYIEKITLYFLLNIFVPDMVGLVVGIIYGLDLGIDIEVTLYLMSFVIYSLALVFKYGYYLQLDSKSTMYGTNE